MVDTAAFVREMIYELRIEPAASRIPIRLIPLNNDMTVESTAV